MERGLFPLPKRLNSQENPHVSHVNRSGGLIIERVINSHSPRIAIDNYFSRLRVCFLGEKTGALDQSLGIIAKSRSCLVEAVTGSPTSVLVIALQYQKPLLGVDLLGYRHKLLRSSSVQGFSKTGQKKRSRPFLHIPPPNRSALPGLGSNFAAVEALYLRSKLSSTFFSVFHQAQSRNSDGQKICKIFNGCSRPRTRLKT